MRLWGVVWLFAFAGCYRGPSGLSPCTIRCTDGCPSGTSCVGGFCAAAGESCALDAQPCGEIGAACCESAPACVDNGYCSQGTCQAGCVTSIAPGRHHMCVLGHDGSVSCSGANDIAQLGGGSFGGPASTFARATDANGPIADATAVCSGRDHSCAVRAGGTVWCWGAGGSGQLGNTQYSDSAVAVQVVLDSGEPLAGISELACGHSHSCALASDQTVWCWGDNNNGQIGDNTGVGRATALQVPGLSGVAALASGARFVCTLDTSSQVRCWGDNGAGEIGDGTSNTAYQPSALALANVTAIATGPFHTCALLADSTMQCWGANTRRWLGTGTSRNVSQLSPLPVLETDGVTPYSGAIAIAAGAVTCALRANGHVDCWSDDVHGQSGNGGTALPRPVLDGNHDLTGVDKLTAHYAHVCAHRTDGSIMCWGRNTEGEYGDGTTRNHGSPSPLGASCGSTN